jgi:hypothetical protein
LACKQIEERLQHFQKEPTYFDVLKRFEGLDAEERKIHSKFNFSWTWFSILFATGIGILVVSRILFVP